MKEKWEKLEDYLKDRPWLIGILLAIPVVVIIWLVQRKKGAIPEDYQAAGMIYQPPAGGGGGGVSSGSSGESSDSSMVTMLTDFLSGLSQREEAQSKQLQDFLKAQAESQKSFMEGISKTQTTNLPAMMPEVMPEVPKFVVMPEVMPEVTKPSREIYFSPSSSFKIPEGQVRVTDMPGNTRDEQWKQFEQTIAYDYLGSAVKEAQSKVANLGGQWWSAKTPQEKTKIHQQAELERQRIYQEIARGGAGFTVSWYDTGVGHKKLKVTTPKGEVIDI